MTKFITKRTTSFFEALEKKAEELAKKYDCRFVDNETPYERVEERTIQQS